MNREIKEVFIPFEYEDTDMSQTYLYFKRNVRFEIYRVLQEDDKYTTEDNIEIFKLKDGEKVCIYLTHTHSEAEAIQFIESIRYGLNSIGKRKVVGSY